MFKRALAKVMGKGSEVLRAGHPILRLVATPVRPQDIQSGQFKAIVKSMTSVFGSKLTPVLGLAAPQIGHSIRLIGFQCTDKQFLEEQGIKEQPLKFIINPKLTILKKSIHTDYEFCESIPHYSGLVKRAEKVRITGLDLDGKPISEEHSGMMARILQHECDHLDATMFTDKMEPCTLRHDQYVGKYEIYRN